MHATLYSSELCSIYSWTGHLQHSGVFTIPAPPLIPPLSDVRLAQDMHQYLAGKRITGRSCRLKGPYQGKVMMA
ncbi:hypothetical protein OPV22_018980 [Ensete ventricosum]|uniref:Uncharacterized protein n=1 Tax=Ensete ventricosum TaxID=4639 RepID=A0AAV8R368_ENSVE|nr:hypothetical protein OPV22_018980 [Ensete ventricosum]